MREGAILGLFACLLLACLLACLLRTVCTVIYLLPGT